MKTLTTNQQNAAAAEHVVLCALVEIQFAGGTVRFTDAPHDITAMSQTWLGVGRLGAVEAVQETADGSATSVKLSLAGTVASTLSAALTEQMQRPCNIYIAFLSPTTLQPIDTPVLEWAGLTDSMELSEAAGESKITLTVANRFAAFARPKVRRHSDQEQRARYAGDRFYEYAATMTTRPLVWPTRAWQEHFTGPNQ